MRIAIIGCGYIADGYLKTLPQHPELQLVGVTDKDPERVKRFSAYHSVPGYDSIEELLAIANPEIVLNLTNPRSHYQVSKACLEAGKHVYSEKPMGMTLQEAKELVALAEQQGLQISSAPCSLLGETAQTVWKALREQVVGKVRLVYAEMDEGMMHQMSYKEWLSDSGTPWPYKDEFEIGCTLEHAGYYLPWLTAFFGPAETVTAFSSCLIPDKNTDVALVPPDTPDFSVACIKFTSGVVARLTCSIVAPHNHSLRIVGDTGTLGIEDCWFYGAPVYYMQKMLPISLLSRIFRKLYMILLARKYPIWFNSRYPLVRKPADIGYHSSTYEMDFCRGVAELAAAIKERRPSRISSRFSLHNNELVLAINNALETGSTYKLTTTFDPIEPMPWAK